MRTTRHVLFLALLVVRAGAASAAPPAPIDVEEGKKHWAFRPLASVTPPAVKSAAWQRNPLDAFVLAGLERKGLTPAAELDRVKLIRRATFDLTGLPPTPEEVDAFLNDPAPDAYERLVDRLLLNERHGERWARHWLDVVRFAESGGYEFDKDRPGAYYYRDFVIRALNEDLPFDEFVRLQVAGDHLKSGDLRATAATGFLVAGPFPGQTTAKTLLPIRYDHLDDMATTLASSLLGLTFGCARCHDHKYDPIAQRDYYRLLACLGRTDSAEVKFPVEGAAAVYQKAKAEFDRVHAPLVAARDKFEKEELPGRLSAWLEANKTAKEPKAAVDLRALLEKTGGKPAGKDLAEAVRLYRTLDAQTQNVYKKVEDSAKKEPKPNELTVFAAASGKGGEVHFLIRGEVERKDGVASPGFIRVLERAADGDRRWLADASGKNAEPRVALARWLTDADAGAGPLLARVIVNRLWQHHFGKGLVRTPNDFGTRGDPPTHPELLDYLAAELIRNGWHLRPIHRLLMTSAAYRQGGDAGEAALRADPDNRLWGRVPPRRLEAEAVRDALLSVSGTLDRTMYGPGTLDENGPRRSVYLTVKRSRLMPMMQLFDAPEPIQAVGERSTTTVATQALALMNSPFVRQRAEKLAQRVRPKDAADLPRAVEEAYRLALGRRPTPAERDRLSAFVLAQSGGDAKALDAALADACQALLASNEFLYID
jgi:hypothetical protein